MNKLAGLFAAVASLAFPFAASAQSPEEFWRGKDIRLLIGADVGGTYGLYAQLMVRHLKAHVPGQPNIVLQVMPGAGGNVGAEIVVRASPDGYTVLTSTSTLLTVNPSLYRMPFNVEKDLQPVTVLSGGEQVVVVHPTVPAKSLQELIALAKQKPGSLNYSSAGQGTALHLGAELLKLRAGIDMTQVAYKGGGPAAAAVLAGEVQVLVGTIASTITFINAGRLRALATTGPKRSRLLPDQPTVAESGYPGFDAGVWFGMTVPAATSKSVIDRLNRETVKALQYADVQAAMARQGLDAAPGTPAELAERIKRETATWAAVIKKTGIRAE